ncbi:MAG: LacI family transcriptional regulator [Bacteroidetes bacterium]|nr:MAG: LacI family transcriptional regulator [Bacteroidota bacterium]RLD73603.1 MAG: LacI family transcriptional regulator [Bacteroidota bacterium]
MKHQVTIKDIARKLGVSTSTVSRALKDHPDISVKTREAVKELANILGYKPNMIALNLKHSRTNTIGVLVPEVEHYFFSSVLNGVEEVAYKNNFSVMVFQSNESYMREVLIAQNFLTNRVDGVLASFSKNTHDFSHFKQIIENEIPLVFFDRERGELHADSVIVDDYSGAYHAVSHLISKGSRRIAFYSAPQHLVLGKNRLEGYKAALEDHGITYNPELVYSCDTFDEAEKISRSILKKHDRPDAIFAVNDLTAIGAMKVAKKLGLRVPDDIRFVGFENSRSSWICEPELTTVDQFGFELGKEATGLLLARIKLNTFEYEVERRMMKTQVVVRGTT